MDGWGVKVLVFMFVGLIDLLVYMNEMNPTSRTGKGSITAVK